MKSALIFIISTLTQLYLLVLLLRFWLPWLRADFRNPAAQAILRLTSPVVHPVRRIVPPIGRVDTATVLIACGIQYLTILAILGIRGIAAGTAEIVLTSIADLGLLSLRIFVFAIFIRVLLSWFAPGRTNPATAILATITDPILIPFRRLIPSLGGFDISPVFALIVLMAMSMVITDIRPLPI